jgi:hypothetical protein
MTTIKKALPERHEPDWIELERVVPLPEVTRITTLSRDALRRRFSHWIVQLSPRRKGMQMRRVLEIAGHK